MKLSTEDVKLFYKINWALLFYVNQKYPVKKNLKEPMFKDMPVITSEDEHASEGIRK